MSANKVISIYGTPSANFNSSAFACGHVIIYIGAHIPIFMDCLLAEFHRACIYTVPEHIVYLESSFETKEAYFKSLGYRFEDGKLEITNEYLNRLESCMKLLGALLQTEAHGVTNMPCLDEGWIWLARFLNNLPANVYTAVALGGISKYGGICPVQKIQVSVPEDPRICLSRVRERNTERLQRPKDQIGDHETGRLHRIQCLSHGARRGWLLRASLLSSDLLILSPEIVVF